MSVRPNMMVPNWSMPPKVLLVEDDDTCRRLSSRLLQIFGCPFDVAEDGVAAVGKMSHQKYDIVLMVRLHSRGVPFYFKSIYPAWPLTSEFVFFYSILV